MDRHERQKRSIQFDALERRETPSTLLGDAGHLHDLAARRTGTAFRGTGAGTLISETPLPGGGAQTVAAISGRATLIGRYTGTLTNDFSSPTSLIPTATTADVVAADGSHIDILSTGGGSHQLRGRIFRGSIPFIVTGGTGTFAGVSGRGVLSETADYINGTLRFFFNGRINRV